MGGPIERYRKLGLRASLSLSFRYPLACRELGIIVRLSYSKSSKALQSLLLEDTLIAFRLLPLMQTQSAVSAANLLFQSTEAVLPKQKRVQAATEYKQAKVAYKRRGKIHQEVKDHIQLPQDVLLHLFSFLDMQSLASAGIVCRSWNLATNDNYLWQFHYMTHFGDSESYLKIEGLRGNSHADVKPSNGVWTDANLDWKDVFRRAYSGLPSWRYKYNRGYCGLCKAIVWLSNLKCPNRHPVQQSENQRLRPVSPSQIVRYIEDGAPWVMYSSDSDSESDEEIGFKFWTYVDLR